MPTKFFAHRQHEAPESFGGADAVSDDLAVTQPGSSPNIGGELLDCILVTEVSVEHGDSVWDLPQRKDVDHLNCGCAVSPLLIHCSL